MRKGRRLFLKNLAALSTIGAVGVAADLPVYGGPLTTHEQEMARSVVECSYFIRYLDERGAVYEARPGAPGWYQATWSDPALGDEPITWAASVDVVDFDWMFARSFRAKVEGIENF